MLLCESAQKHGCQIQRAVTRRGQQPLDLCQ
nr:MAG TPA: hypothetical protein [Caudoviricetes sp.]